MAMVSLKEFQLKKPFFRGTVLDGWMAEESMLYLDLRCDRLVKSWVFQQLLEQVMPRVRSAHSARFQSQDRSLSR